MKFKTKGRMKNAIVKELSDLCVVLCLAVVGQVLADASALSKSVPDGMALSTLEGLP